MEAMGAHCTGDAASGSGTVSFHAAVGRHCALPLRGSPRRGGVCPRPSHRPRPRVRGGRPVALRPSRLVAVPVNDLARYDGARPVRRGGRALRAALGRHRAAGRARAPAPTGGLRPRRRRPRDGGSESGLPLACGARRPWGRRRRHQLHRDRGAGARPGRIGRRGAAGDRPLAVHPDATANGSPGAVPGRRRRAQGSRRRTAPGGHAGRTGHSRGAPGRGACAARGARRPAGAIARGAVRPGGGRSNRLGALGRGPRGWRPSRHRHPWRERLPGRARGGPGSLPSAVCRTTSLRRLPPWPGGSHSEATRRDWPGSGCRSSTTWTAPPAPPPTSAPSPRRRWAPSRRPTRR